MKRTSLVVAGFSAMLALGLVGYGCTSGDNVSGTGGSTGSGGATTGGGQGGQTTGGGQGGSTTTTSQGGATGSQGGATGSQGGATGSQGGATGSQGGATGGGTGGATGSQGGMTGGGTGGASAGLPMCAPAPKDKAACDLTVATTITPCTKNCGIKASGAQKPCACITSTVTPPTAWDCSNQGACMYPIGFDATCYTLTPAPAACPTTLITTGVTTCTNTAGATCGPLCGSATATSYQDSSMKATIGYCACISGIWQCASAKEWPVTM